MALGVQPVINANAPHPPVILIIVSVMALLEARATTC